MAATKAMKKAMKKQQTSKPSSPSGVGWAGLGCPKIGSTREKAVMKKRKHKAKQKQSKTLWASASHASEMLSSVVKICGFVMDQTCCFNFVV